MFNPQPMIDITEELDPEEEARVLEQVRVQRLMNEMFMYGANPNCDHHVVHASGGGIKCTKCPGWYCI